MRAILRLCLAALLALQPVPGHAACVVDGQQTNLVVYTPTITSQSFIAVTSQRNDWLIIDVSLEPQAGPVPSVTSLTGAGLTWTKRFQQQNVVPTCWSGGNCYTDVEEWYAFSAAPVNSATITITSTFGAQGYATLSFTGVHGSGGFDTNGVLPIAESNLSSSPATIEVPGVYTSSSPDLAIYFCTAFEQAVGIFSTCNSNAVAPWQRISGAAGQNIFSGYGLATTLLSENLPAPVSNVTFQPFGAATGLRTISLVDALTCSASGAFPQVQILD